MPETVTAAAATASDNCPRADVSARCHLASATRCDVAARFIADSACAPDGDPSVSAYAYAALEDRYKRKL